MKFIADQQFLKQPKEIQEVFMNWWKPQIGDLYMWEYYDEEYKNIRVVRPNSKNMLNGTWATDMGIPLLTMEQLLDFIKDTNKFYIVMTQFKHNHWNIVLENGYVFKSTKLDLLQSLWQLSVEVTKQYLIRSK